MGYSPWGRKESDTTEQLTISLSQSVTSGGLTPVPGGLGGGLWLTLETLGPNSHWLVPCVCITVHPREESVQVLSRVRLFVTPWTAARQTSLSITNSRSLLKAGNNTFCI